LGGKKLCQRKSMKRKISTSKISEGSRNANESTLKQRKFRKCSRLIQKKEQHHPPVLATWGKPYGSARAQKRSKPETKNRKGGRYLSGWESEGTGSRDNLLVNILGFIERKGKGKQGGVLRCAVFELMNKEKPRMKFFCVSGRVG